MKSRGGHRVALIVFAAKPLLVCPLTVDYNHLLQRASEISLSAPPTGIYPNDDEPWTSGTRIGSAVRLAVDSHDPRFEGYQDVILISDGDDPSPDRDSEIETGIIAASRQHIPVHCVGVGDSKEGGQIIVEEVPVQTKLEEAPLRTIARLTDGIYFSAGRDLPRSTNSFAIRSSRGPAGSYRRNCCRRRRTAESGSYCRRLLYFASPGGENEIMRSAGITTGILLCISLLSPLLFLESNPTLENPDFILQKAQRALKLST